MSRLVAFGLLIATLSTTGCVGWGPCGNEQFRGPFQAAAAGLCSTCNDHCCNCDGYNPPFGSIGRRLACGSGCGELYWGEWRSNPPNTCNECDARGPAYGSNPRWGWLVNPWLAGGVKYENTPQGYGNPYRAMHRGYGQYGGFRPWRWAGYGSYGGRVYSSGTSGCATGNCAPNAPAGEHLQPIPSGASTNARTPGAIQVSGNMQVNYESERVRGSQAQMRNESQSRVNQLANEIRHQAASKNRAALSINTVNSRGPVPQGRLQPRRSLR